MGGSFAIQSSFVFFIILSFLPLFPAFIYFLSTPSYPEGLIIFFKYDYNYHRIIGMLLFLH